MGRTQLGVAGSAKPSARSADDGALAIVNEPVAATEPGSSATNGSQVRATPASTAPIRAALNRPGGTRASGANTIAHGFAAAAIVRAAVARPGRLWATAAHAMAAEARAIASSRWAVLTATSAQTIASVSSPAIRLHVPDPSSRRARPSGGP